MLNMLLASVSSCIGRAPVQSPLDKLNAMFQVRNRVRNVQTGIVYTVYELRLGGAFLMDDRDQPLIANWLSSAGRLRTEVADKWTLVSHNTATH